MKIKRELYQELTKHLPAKEISLIVGPRQAGKTTLMQSLKKTLDRQGERTLFLNLDVETDKQYFAAQQNLSDKIRLEFGDQKGFVFIDEIQRKENAGLFLKGLYDQNIPCKFIISGSGSLELKEKIHESLVGRKRLFELNPVSFKEFLHFKTGYRYENNLSEFLGIEASKIPALLSEYLNFGGYPRIVTEPVLTEKLKILDEIFRSYIEKDIVYLLDIRRPETFRQLIRLLAAQTGKLLNYSELAPQVGVSFPTVKKFLYYAQKTFVVKAISPFFQNYRKEITKSQTIYFYDLGMRNYALGVSGTLNNPTELSFLFQNLIANMLEEKLRWTGATLHFWRTADQAEVDFVIKRGHLLAPIEVKYTSLKRPLLKKSLRSFIEKYSPETAYVINLDFRDRIAVNGTTVRFLPFYALMDSGSLFA